MKTQDIGKHVMAKRGLNTSDKRLVKLIGKRVGACLRHHKTKGLVESEQWPGQHMVWWTVR